VVGRTSRTGISVAGPWINQVEIQFGASGQVSLGALTNLSGDGAFGFMMVALAIPGLVPGLSSVIGPLLGLALISLGVQFLWGNGAPWIPTRLQSLNIHRTKVWPLLVRIDGLFSRWGHKMSWMDRPVPGGWIGAGVIWAGLVLGSPLGFIPMSNAAPALAVCLMGISIIDEAPSFAWIGLGLLLLYTLFIGSMLFLYWNVLIEPFLTWIASLL